MKIIQTLLTVGLAMVIASGCVNSSLPVEASAISRIRITKFPGNTMLADIEDEETIARMIAQFSYGDQRHLPVKHPLPILIDLYAGTSVVCHVSCENRMMRTGPWEYTMSRSTARMIQKAIENGTANKAVKVQNPAAGF